MSGLKSATIGIAVTLGLGVVLAVASSIDYETGATEGVLEYVYVEQVVGHEAKYSAREFQVHGNVVHGTLAMSADGEHYAFEIEHGGARMKVRYFDHLPDTFAEGGEVVMTGRFAADGTFDSKTMSAKCPSKYEEKDAGPLLRKT